ncbi:MAG TPA: nucleotide exchange factor GrpE, partial [Elusimicrobiota bacterium]|nr:nucleotide exchange factor GrpE [Elusimicrobiota bacterium]
MKDERDAEAAEAEGAGEELSPQDAAVAMAKELASKEAENKALYDQLLRMKAEFENYRKRVDREKPDWYRLGAAGVLAKLLPLFDLLRHAHQEIQADHSETPLAKGMDAI